MAIPLLPAMAQEEEARGTDAQTGLIIDDGWELVKAHCGGCHSLSLVQQNRGDADHWKTLIRWMQEKHNLWQLGPQEGVILSYLASNYGTPSLVPRRKLLETVWLEEPDKENEP